MGNGLGIGMMILIICLAFAAIVICFGAMNFVRRRHQKHIGLGRKTKIKSEEEEEGCADMLNLTDSKQQYDMNTIELENEIEPKYVHSNDEDDTEIDFDDEEMPMTEVLDDYDTALR